MTTETLTKPKHAGGRPRIEIPEDLLRELSVDRNGRKRKLQIICSNLKHGYGITVSPKTIRRRRKESGI